MGQFAKLCRPNSQFVPIAGVSGGTFPAKDSLRDELQCFMKSWARF